MVDKVKLRQEVPPTSSAGSSNNSDQVKESAPSQQPEEKPSINYFSLYRYADRVDIVLIIFGFLGAVVNGLTLPAFTVIFGELVNELGEDSPNLTEQVNDLALYFVYLAIVSWAASYFEVGFWMWSGARQAATIRKKYLQAILKQDITFFDRDQTSGALMQGLNDDTLAIQQAVSEKVGNTVHHLATFIGGMAVAFWRGWQLTLVILAVLPLIVVCGAIVTKFIGSAQTKLNDAYSEANSLATQAISNVRTVVAFNGEEKTLSKYDQLLFWPMKLGIQINIFSGSAIGVVNLVVFGAYGLALWYGNERIIENNSYDAQGDLMKDDQGNSLTGSFQGGDVLNVIFAAIIAGFSLGQGAPNLAAFVKGVATGDKVFKVISRIPEIRDDPNAIKLDKLNGQLELRNVSFCYPARPDVEVFNDLSIVIPSGKTVALVGQSGSGKSTVVQLLERFYDPIQGLVSLDGVDIRQLNLTWYRSQIGLVSQEPTLFASTIRENILYGSSGATEAEIIKAAKAANAYRFISHLPNGLDTQVGERGVQLSGGQKQRIAIARAILKNPKIMLLDEATSALDTQSEKIVQEALDNMIVGRTTVVIAHRLSTIRNADIIAVVQDGAIVEQGSHDELIQNQSGAYYTLVKLQQQHVSKEQDEESSTKVPIQDVDEVIMSTDDPSITHSYGESKRASVDIMRWFQPSSEARNEQSRRSVEMKSIKEDSKQLVEGDGSGEEEQDKEKKVGMMRLWQYNKSEWPFAIFGGFASICLGAAMPTFSIALTDMVEVFFMTNKYDAQDGARKWALIFFAIGAGWLIFSLVQQYCFGVMGQKLAKRIRQLLMGAILRQEIGWFDKDENTSGSITSRLATDTLYVRGAVGDALGLLVQNIVTIVAGFVIAFITDWKMALVISAIFPLMAVASITQTKFIMGFSSSADKLLAGANQVAQESISSVRVVQAFNMQSQIVNLYVELMRNPQKSLSKQSHVTGFMFGLSFFIIFCAYALAFWYGGRRVEEGLKVDEMLRVFFAIILGAMGAANAQMQFPDIGKAGAAVERVFEVIDREPKIKDKEDARDGNSVQGAIQLKDVDFYYPARASVQVFKKFNLTVAPGATVALVGESGSGKSTVVGLIERFYEPLSGQVTLDGVDIQSLKLKWLRDQIGLVSQEPILFSMSIEENIKYGKEEATYEEVQAAARIANAASFIEKLPEQYQTQVGEQGIQLSGGQKQRVAIARAVIKNPRILLLDEATSALDAESEKVVQDALDSIMHGRTTIVIAHRLSTIRNADNIAVVNKGIVAEQGTHEQLMSYPKGLYQQMVRAQNQRK